MNNDLISREALREKIQEIVETEMPIDEKWAMGLRHSLKLIDNAPTIEYPFYAEAYQTGYEEGKNERQPITIPQELINRMAMVIAETIDKIDWNAFIDKYIEMEKEWKNEEQNRQGN